MTSPPTQMPLSPWLQRVWLERYLERGLSPEEAAWFEAYMLDQPDLLDRVDADCDLRDGLGLVATADSPGAERTARSPPDVPGTRRSGRSAAWGLAASLLIGIGLGALIQRPTSDGDARTAVLASPTRVIYDAMRGEALQPRIERGSAVQLVEIGLPPTATHISVQIGDGPAQDLLLSPDGFVSFVLLPNRAPSVGREARLRYQIDAVTTERTLLLPKPGENRK